jgi:hypothetical protein
MWRRAMTEITITNGNHDNAWIHIVGTGFDACIAGREAAVALTLIRSGEAADVSTYFDCGSTFVSFHRNRIDYCETGSYATFCDSEERPHWGYIKFKDNGTVEKILESVGIGNGEVASLECDIEEVR